MTRRNLIGAALASGISMPIPAANQKPSILELRWLKMRNSPDNELGRTRDFFQNHVMDVLHRSGVTTVGAFTCSIGQDSPFLLAVSEFPSMAALETAGERVWSDAGFLKAYAEYAGSAPRVYEREEVMLLRSFSGFPAIRPPQSEEGKAHTFELRMYESTNGVTLARKVKMFNTGEIGIFERLGMKPVFFGETIAGSRMPNLIYMLSFDDLGARQKLWGEFVSDPAWKKMSSIPEYSDSLIVSNISNWILQPLDFSQIR
ncbi:MAG TPA: NIPSNAP family protein [Bryobacteraceae bacterium]|jgi:hypothetical protein|nr:NIPSNAP family protein [Bryobacteraceae bacterium]